MRKMLILCALMLSACAPMPMSNTAIITSAKQCTDAGLDWATLSNELGYIITVQCRPKKDNNTGKEGRR